MKTTLLFCSAATLLAATGCALSPADQVQASDRSDPQYVTGSNIARHQPARPADGVTTLDRDEVERIHDSTIVGMPAPRAGGSH